MDELIPDDEVLAKDLEDLEFRAWWDRTAFARAVGVEIASYRADHSLSQREMADRLGVTRAEVACIEDGEHTPDAKTLARCSATLGPQRL